MLDERMPHNEREAYRSVNIMANEYFYDTGVVDRRAMKKITAPSPSSAFWSILEERINDFVNAMVDKRRRKER